MTSADFAGFLAAQNDVDALAADSEAWTRKSILNAAASGCFSTDRTMHQYNDDIWRLTPLADR